MTIEIQLDSELSARLVAEAASRGVAPEKLAERLLRDAIVPNGESQGKLSVEELHEMLRAVAAGADRLPRVPTSAFRRDSFYEDRP
jgi:hypothetical protein